MNKKNGSLQIKYLIMAKHKNISNLDIGDQHRILVDKVNELYPNYFPKRKGMVYSNEVLEKVSLENTKHLAIIASRLLNMTGGSVGDINLYELFGAYFTNPEKRAEINLIIKNR